MNLQISTFSRPAALVVAGFAALGCLARGDSLTEVWRLAPDDRPYVTTANLERGLAFEPVSQRVLLLSRAGGVNIYVLDKATGADGSDELGEPRKLSQQDANGEFPISGGTFALNLVGAADDGAVYACNLATSLGTVRIYRWADVNPDTPVSVAYAGDPLAEIASPGSGQDIRFGDNFAVRGAGPNTQLVQTARNGKYIILYTTEDGVTFTNRTFVSPATIAGKIGLGVTFGEGDTIWAKLNGNELQRIQLNLATGQATLLNTVPTSIVGGGVTGISVDPVAKRLAAVDYSAHQLSVFDISDPSGLVRIGDPLPFATAVANVNGTGAAAIRGDDAFGLDTNNGLLAAKVEKSVIVDPPTIVTQPAGGTVYAGATFTFAVSAQGTPPFTYQWAFNDAPLPNATSSQLVLTNLTVAQAGEYAVTVSNSAGSATSAKATLTVLEPLNSGVLRPLWALNLGDRPYLTGDNTQRGLAYNPATGNLLLASRSPSNLIVVLDAATGAEKHRLRTTGADELPVFFGGTLLLNMIGVADDGVVYAGNLVTDGSTATFNLYRWDNDSPDAVPVPLGPVADLSLPERWGDTMDVRGQGANTQILLGTRGLAPQEGRKFALLTTVNGFDFAGQVFTVEGVASSAFGLGIAFGPGNSVFGTANGQPVVHVAFDPASGTATLARTYPAAQIPNSLSFLGFDPAKNLLAGVALETPDNVRLYDLTNLDEPVFRDQRLILPEQPNINGTGSVDFGDDKLFALDTNSGLRAYEITAGTPAGPATLGSPALVNGQIRFDVSGTPGASYVVQKAAAVTGPWTDLQTVTAPATVTDAAAGAAAFYRAIAR
jgi:hypothetical protein